MKKFYFQNLFTFKFIKNPIKYWKHDNCIEVFKKLSIKIHSRTSGIEKELIIDKEIQAMEFYRLQLKMLRKLEKKNAEIS